MQIFRNVNLTWWQVSALKISVLLFGIVIGVVWQKEFQPYLYQMFAGSLILGVYLFYVWHGQANKSKK